MAFVEKHGSINENIRLYREDVQNSLLASIEKKTVEVRDGMEVPIYSKEGIFYNRTISYTEDKEHFDNCQDALVASVNKYESVNIDYIHSHTGIEKEDIVKDLAEKRSVFIDPDKLRISGDIYQSLEIREVYLSGNVRRKLESAEAYIRERPDQAYINYNIDELKRIMPKPLTGNDIKIAIGSNIIRTEDYARFISDLLDVNENTRSLIKVSYEGITSTYSVTPKNLYSFNNAKKYGTSRINAMEIFEALLNKRTIEIRDSETDNATGRKSYVINPKETALAKNKSEEISKQFEEWLWNDDKRAEYYEEKYNRLFNSEVIPEYDGSSLTIPYMSNDIILRPHQKNAITRAIRGNTLVAHPVGAGKTFVIAGAAMKLKSIGAANKPLIAVPNAIVGQVASDFMKMFPAANVLAVSEKDFETKRRKQFISKIAMGNYDAVIMGHSQFGLIGISPKRQAEEIGKSIEQLTGLIDSMDDRERHTIKQLEKIKKSYKEKIERLMNADVKDTEIYFEELGIDALMVDEAHEFKNLEVTTKMGRVKGIQTAASQKSFDLYLKCKYIREIKGNRNILFSTGTPLSNTVCEMYTWQRFLAEGSMREKGINNFDDWASVFTEVNNVWEVAPEGDKFQAYQKINKFRNIPELKKMFNAFADVLQKSDINLPVPKLAGDKYNIVEVQPCEAQKMGQKSIISRANAVRKGNVDPRKDNLLKICSDARKLSIDPRLIWDEGSVDHAPDGRTKLDACVDNVAEIYYETNNFKGTQVIFSDIGTPNSGKSFNVYEYLKKELIKKGIPENEICFIHDAGGDKQKTARLHEDMRTGRKRVIIGSTIKLGTGTNIQNLLVAEHDLDCPWRPSDVERAPVKAI